MTWLSRNIVAISVELILAVGITRVDFENQSVIMTICLFSVMLFGSGPQRSIVTNTKGPAASKI